MISEDWRLCLLPPSASVQDVIRSLDRSGQQIVVVVGAGDELVGTITDGDIRRGLLAGADLASAAETILHRDPLVVPPDLGRNAVRQLMQANKVRQLPIIDQQRRVMGMHLWDELHAPAGVRANTMVIMAGGRGVRLRPHTESCPKPMLPVGGKPMLEHILERARDEGFAHFVLAIHYLGHMIEDHFGDGGQWGVRIDYLREREPLGTGGALSLLMRPQYPFLVTNGDVLTDVRYGEILDFHRRHEAAATMAVRAHEWQHPFGVVRIEGMEIVGFEEKPVHRTHINAGIYVLEPFALDTLERGAHCNMPMLFERLQEMGRRTIVYPMHEPWLDVGRPVDLEQARSAHA